MSFLTRSIYLYVALFGTVDAFASCINNQVHFSDTQTWGSEELRLLKSWKPTWIGYIGNERELTGLSSLPDAEGLTRDLNSLRSQQKSRTDADLPAIVGEADVCGWDLGGFQFGTDSKKDEFLASIFYDASNIGLHLKLYFDRPRPSYCDADIKAVISIPQHPAFPSNHSLEAHVLAAVLADLVPSNRNRFFESADKIAGHRELAGLHYPSDTKFGVIIANWMYQHIKTNSGYKKLMAELTNVKNAPVLHLQMPRRVACERFFEKFRKRHGISD